MIDVSNRLKTNEKIVEKISEMVKRCPELRFTQLLWALGFYDGQDNFYEEPEQTLAKIEKKCNLIMGEKDADISLCNQQDNR